MGSFRSAAQVHLRLRGVQLLTCPDALETVAGADPSNDGRFYCCIDLWMADGGAAS